MDQYQPLAADDPRRLGAYDLLGRLGEGGQGVVYLGRSDSGEQVAVKLLHHAAVADPDARTRFLREVAVAQRVARFCTAPVLHADLEGSRPYIVSEFVPGPSLRELVINEGPRRGAALERLAISTATALAAIHRAGILHRDLKPANVLMGPEGPVVIDFGIARALDSPGATATGMAMGTPSYLAPEQLSGAAVSEAADVFAWGVTMVYAATGTPAFGSDSIPVVMNRILHEEPQLGGMDGTLGELVALCLSKDPALRPSADELIVRLTGQPAPRAAVEPVTGGQAVPGVQAVPGGPQAAGPHQTGAQLPHVPQQPAGPHPSGPHPGAPQHGSPQHGAPQQGVPHQGVPQAGGPQPGGPQPGGPQPGGQHPGAPYPAGAQQAGAQHPGMPQAAPGGQPGAGGGHPAAPGGGPQGAWPGREAPPFGHPGAQHPGAGHPGAQHPGAGHPGAQGPHGGGNGPAGPTRRQGGPSGPTGPGGQNGPDGEGGQAAKHRRTLTFALSGAAAAALLVVAGAVVVQANADKPTEVVAVGSRSQVTPTDGSGGGQPLEPPADVIIPETDDTVPPPELEETKPSETGAAQKQPSPLQPIPTHVQIPATVAPPQHTKETPADKTSEPAAKPTKTKKQPDNQVDPATEPTSGADTGTVEPPPAQSTARPTAKPTAQPTVKPTVKPTAKPTAAPLKPNPYTPAQVCGTGYKVIDSHALGGSATVYLLYNTGAGKNCVVTMSKLVYPGKVAMNAVLQVKGGSSGSNPGSFTAYAGPVRLGAKKQCVIWGGSWKTLSWKSGWSHCG